MPVSQKAQPRAQPTWEETQRVRVPPNMGTETDSTVRPSPRRKENLTVSPAAPSSSARAATWGRRTANRARSRAADRESRALGLRFERAAGEDAGIELARPIGGRGKEGANLGPELVRGEREDVEGRRLRHAGSIAKRRTKVSRTGAAQPGGSESASPHRERTLFATSGSRLNQGSAARSSGKVLSRRRKTASRALLTGVARARRV